MIRLAILTGIIGLAAPTAILADPDRGPADRFVASLGNRSDVPAKAVQLIRERWNSCDDCDPEEFLVQGLAVISDDFRTALDAYDGEEYMECAARMAELAKSDDPFVAMNAAGFEIKSLVALDQTIEAQERIQALWNDGGEKLTQHSYFAPEVAFLDGYCYLADLQYEAAAFALNGFLENYPGVSPRLEIAAKQILLELANRSEGKMGDVVDLMQYSHRRLKNADGGDPVQKRQDRILELLDVMIEEAEAKEKAACSGGGGGQSGQQNSGGMAPSNPMQDSMLPGGNPEEGNLREMRRANPGEMWGQMPPAERERVLQALRDSFPSRYRRLVEQYYEELAKKP